VLDDAERRGAETILCLGDIAELGPQPREALGLARERCDVSVIGNCDGWLTHYDPMDAAPARADVGRWAIEQLGEEGLDWLRGLPLVARHGDVALFHATPAAYNEELPPDIADDQLRERLAGLRGPVLAGGHMHVQWTRRLGDRVFVNPGTVGCAEAPGSPAGGDRHRRYRAEAEYALVEDGRVELVQVPYDVERTRHAIRAGGMPHPDVALRRLADA